jgi:hypothetical protein
MLTINKLTTLNELKERWLKNKNVKALSSLD